MDTFQTPKCQNNNHHRPLKITKFVWPSILTVKNAEHSPEPGLSMKCCKTESNINVFYKSFPLLLLILFIELKDSFMNMDYWVFQIIYETLINIVSQEMMVDTLICLKWGNS